MDTPTGTKSIADPRKWAHAWFQYGALGLIVVAMLVTGGWLLHIFVPIWVQHFADDAKAQLAQTEAMKEIKTTLQDMRVEMRNDRESLTAAISLASKRR